jgi:hypothetical protein
VPLYLVRWPDLSAALVNAKNEDALINILDEVANPEGCTWEKYVGPLFIDFAVNAKVSVTARERGDDRPLRPDELRVDDVSRICNRDILTATVAANSETADDMVDAILETAFPALHAAIHESDGIELAEDDVRSAVMEELDVLVKATWRQQQTKRRDDHVSRVAAAMGTSPRHVENLARAAERAEAKGKTRPTPRPRKPTPPKRTPPQRRGRRR